MARSRTIRVLAALLIAMTFGALILMVLETNPVRDKTLAALSGTQQGDADKVIFDTLVPVQPIKWRNIVIHAGGAGRGDVASRCHFIIADSNGVVTATAMWKQQVRGSHVSAPGRDWNDDSIGICLVGKFSRTPPSGEQFSTLVELVRRLQRRIPHISADHVYLHRDIDARTTSPGSAFPADEFDRLLLRPRR